MGVFAPVFPLLALVGYIFVLIINYGAIAGKWFGDLDVGEVSDKYNVSLTPSGWTFGIWGMLGKDSTCMPIIFLFFFVYRSQTYASFFFFKFCFLV